MGYTTYVIRVPVRPWQIRHESDNKVESERAAFALDLVGFTGITGPLTAALTLTRAEIRYPARAEHPAGPAPESATRTRDPLPPQA